MGLAIPGGLFGTQRGIGESAREQRAATVVVAVDGSGDTDTVQDGINLLPPGGGVVYIKEGTYNINSAITTSKSNVAIIGAGKATNIQTSSNISMISIVSGEDPTIEGIFISQILFTGAGAGNTSNKGIDLDAEHSTISNCWYNRLGSTAVNVEALLYAIITENHFDSNIAKDILIKNCDHVNVIGNTSLSAGTDNIHIDSATYINIIGNTSRDPVNEGISLVGASFCVIGSNSIFSGTRDGIRLNASDRNTINGNVCRVNSGYGINISNSACDNNIVSANVCTGNGSGQINDAGTNTLPNGAQGTTNLALDDLNMIN